MKTKFNKRQPVLKQLVYRSQSTVKIDENELLKITNDSLPFNAKNHITGILLFDGEYFFQVLEGDCEKVTGFSNI
tara:strand:- start:338 stop:562 length:225 start_codon:yes stop_codon:yes gene_type:complete